MYEGYDGVTASREKTTKAEVHTCKDAIPYIATEIIRTLCQHLCIISKYAYGYLWEELQQDSEDKLKMLSLIDILVDGRFLQDKMDLSLQFRGSSNQRIIDVPKSLTAGKVVIWDKLVK